MEVFVVVVAKRWLLKSKLRDSWTRQHTHTHTQVEEGPGWREEVVTKMSKTRTRHTRPYVEVKLQNKKMKMCQKFYMQNLGASLWKMCIWPLPEMQTSISLGFVATQSYLENASFLLYWQYSQTYPLITSSDRKNMNKSNFFTLKRIGHSKLFSHVFPSKMSSWVESNIMPVPTSLNQTYFCVPRVCPHHLVT